MSGGNPDRKDDNLLLLQKAGAISVKSFSRQSDDDRDWGIISNTVSWILIGKPQARIVNTHKGRNNWHLS